MTALKWSSSFDLGVERIDFEHRIFLGLIQAYVEAVKSSAERERLRRMIKEIRKYAEFHFLSEENLMLDVGYPDYHNHHDLHKYLLAQLEDFGHDIAVGARSYEQLGDFLFEWFALHTTTVDKHIADFIAANPEARKKLASWSSPL